MANEGQNNFLYLNNGNSNAWVNIELDGTQVIGSKVSVKADISGTSTWQYNQLSSQTGYGSQNSLNAEFGLGNATIIDSIKVIWPNGQEQYLENQGVNQFITITFPINGCTDSDAVNFNAEATEDDGTCQYISGITSGDIVNDGGNS